jgi:alpha-tubulin suppressor-like RCC1 family protein
MNLLPSWSSASEHSIFVTSEGRYLVCGHNQQGSLGLGDQENRLVLTPFTLSEEEEGTKIKSLACGQHNLALTRDGRIFVWGRQYAGELGTGTSEQCVTRPVLLPFSEGKPVFIACGVRYSGLITESGSLYMWGDNTHGQLGCKGSDVKVKQPTKVLGLPPVVEISCGGLHTVARTRGGEIWTWGYNTSGQTGHDKETPEVSSPVVLPPFPENIIKVACGSHHTLFLGDRGSLWICGWNSYLNCGIVGEPSIVPPRLLFSGEGPSASVKEISAGGCHSLILLGDGSLRVWGQNIWGQLGIGNSDEISPVTPLRFSGGEVAGIGCCLRSSFVITQEGDLWTWGAGLSTGHGDRWNKPEPRKLEGLKFWVPRTKWWKEAGVWIFLGKEDGGSQFHRLPVEVIYNFVNLSVRMNKLI